MIHLYCRFCGQPYTAPASFCSRCGSPIHPVTQPAIKKPRRTRLFLTLGIVLIATAALGLAVWQLGEQTGVWRRLAVKRAADSWRSQNDANQIETAIGDSLQAMAADLERGQIEQALSGIHPDRQERYRSQLNEQADKAVDFAAALRSAKVIYISSGTGNYESDRMALVSAPLPDSMLDETQDDSQAGQTFTLVLVWYEDRWVIDS